MDDQNRGQVRVAAKVENLADLFEARRGVREDRDIRRIEVPDALVHPDVFGLLMPLRLVEQLGLEPLELRWVSRIFKVGRPFEIDRSIPHRAVVLTILGRDCTMEVGAIADDLPVIIGQIPLESMDWVVDMRGQRLIGNPEHGGEDMVDIF